jgi:hypothetical protein
MYRSTAMQTLILHPPTQAVHHTGSPSCPHRQSITRRAPTYATAPAPDVTRPACDYAGYTIMRRGHGKGYNLAKSRSVTVFCFKIRCDSKLITKDFHRSHVTRMKGTHIGFLIGDKSPFVCSFSQARMGLISSAPPLRSSSI